MGARGPKPTPTARLKARGSRVAAERTKEPVPPAGKPVMPRYLSPMAKTLWKSLVKMLYPMGVLTVADAPLLARYCCDFVTWRKAQKEVDREGPLSPVYKVICLEDGSSEAVEVGTHPNPALKVIKDVSPWLDKAEAKFGMSPADRARIHAHVPFDALKVKGESKKPGAATKKARRTDLL